MRFAGYATWFMIALWLLPFSGHALEPAEVFKIANPSIVVVLTADAKGEMGDLGSGVIVTPHEIVTSCSVLDRAADIVVTQGSSLRTAILRFRDTERDLCQLHIQDPLPDGVAVKLADAKKLEVGRALYVVSAPRGMELTLGRGIISGLREMPGGAQLIQTDAPVSTGSGGGGAFDQDARLIGIVSPQFKQGDSANVVVPSEWIKDIADRVSDLLLPGPAAIGTTASAAGQAAAQEQRPAWMPAVGDRWTYQVLHVRRKAGRVTIDITETRDKKVRERITFDASKGFIEEREVEAGFNTSRFQPLVLLPGGFQLAELAPYAEPNFIENSGQRWRGIAAEYSVYGLGRKNLVTSARVVRQERVKVPAGEFDAWKIESESESTTYAGAPITIKCTFWYSPAVKRSVKMQVLTDSDIQVVSTKEIYELTAFESAKQ